ncbi:hypothetical protein EJC49_17630 [Aquibium carbonis]|uniref:Holin-X, holin superfamily III n=1 Tax=Aquibium carbonis TaxID=2495581 RepID=A0A429YUS6_9HYPH|nr:hypothetical protein [Aquibium carbonis]RST85094.1 hypothetical protein EJC49_17630 [Aquibium carbonis]
MIGPLVAAIASANAPRMARRLRRAVIDYAIAGVAFVLGIGFLLVAAFIWAARRWGGLEAAIGFGLGFLLLSVLTLMVHRMVTARRLRRLAERQKADQVRSMATAAAVAAVPALIRQVGIVGSLALPLAALAAYAIWQENRPRTPDEPD